MDFHAQKDNHVQFAKMTCSDGNSIFLNTKYITSYGYLKNRDKTFVSVLSESEEMLFPGNQTAEIRMAINCDNSLYRE